jgi:hypothetical protein
MEPGLSSPLHCRTMKGSDCPIDSPPPRLMGGLFKNKL